MIVFSLLNGIKKDELERKELSNEELEKIIKICSNVLPIYDFKDKKFGE